MSGRQCTHLIVHHNPALDSKAAAGRNFPFGTNSRGDDHHVAFESSAVSESQAQHPIGPMMVVVFFFR